METFILSCMTNSVLNEVGVYSTAMITKIIKTNLAIVIDRSHDYILPMIENKTKWKQKLKNSLLLLMQRQFKIIVGN
jgi:hypothetical protein